MGITGNNPNSEIPGLDYVRAVAIPNSNWTASLIANVGEGALETDQPFNDKYAIKVGLHRRSKIFLSDTVSD